MSGNKIKNENKIFTKFGTGSVQLKMPIPLFDENGLEKGEYSYLINKNEIVIRVGENKYIIDNKQEQNKQLKINNEIYYFNII